MEAKNQVQFQPDLSLMSILDRYSGEQQCREALAKARWPKGWRCQGCGHDPVIFCSDLTFSEEQATGSMAN